MSRRDPSVRKLNESGARAIRLSGRAAEKLYLAKIALSGKDAIRGGGGKKENCKGACGRSKRKAPFTRSETLFQE